MRTAINSRAAYFIFPVDPENIQHSVDELATILRRLDSAEEPELFRPVLMEYLQLKRMAARGQPVNKNIGSGS